MVWKTFTFFITYNKAYDCDSFKGLLFFTIPLKVQDKEKIGFAVSSYKGTQPEK